MPVFAVGVYIKPKHEVQTSLKTDPLFIEENTPGLKFNKICVHSFSISELNSSTRIKLNIYAAEQGNLK